jgi:hypothetical protein
MINIFCQCTFVGLPHIWNTYWLSLEFGIYYIYIHTHIYYRFLKTQSGWTDYKLCKVYLLESKLPRVQSNLHTRMKSKQHVFRDKALYRKGLPKF